MSPDDPMNLPSYRRPVTFNGAGKDPVWLIETSDLGNDLNYRLDPRNAHHGFIEPSRAMSLDEYQQALQRTQSSWSKLTSLSGCGGST